MVGQRNLVSAAWEYFKIVEGGAQCQIEGCSHRFLKRASGSSTKFLWSHLDAHHRELAKELGRLGRKRVRKNQCKRISTDKKEEIDYLVNKKFADGFARNLSKEMKSNEKKNHCVKTENLRGITNLVEELNEVTNKFSAYSSSLSPNKKSLTLPVTTSDNAETVDIHCYPSSSEQIQTSFVYTSANNIPSNSSNTMNMNLMDLINGDPETSNVNNMNPPISESPQPILSVNEYFCKMLCAQLNQMTEKQAHMAREKIHSLVGQFLYNDQQQQPTQQIISPTQPKILHQQFSQQYS